MKHAVFDAIYASRLCHAMARLNSERKLTENEIAGVELG